MVKEHGTCYMIDKKDAIDIPVYDEVKKKIVGYRYYSPSINIDFDMVVVRDDNEMEVKFVEYTEEDEFNDCLMHAFNN